MQTSGASRREIAKSRQDLSSLRGAKRRSNPFFLLRHYGLLRGACHRACIRATRWLAMTIRPFENEVGVCAKRSLRSLLETHPSCPDLIRASINLRKKVLSKKDGSPGQA